MAPKNPRSEEEDLSDTSGSSRSSTPGDSGHKRMRIDKSVSVGPSRNSRRYNSFGSQDEYQIGSIVRVSLKNFVTYDSVEFYPGPNLNMIIGPNGTGKSTIVCAIALGLGWNTSLLGRAREISDFVKHGQERSSIEIELKSKKPVVITRTIKKSNNTSLWKLNGKTSTQKDIVSKVNSLNIQVDNLCQFLPQDKVSEFAQLSPPELLIQTQKAVGDKEMSEWHERLIKLREEERSLLSSTKDEEEQVGNLEKRNAVLERDVARYREREAILERIELYELAIPWARYDIAKHKYDVAKRQRAEAHVAYQKLLKENEPMNEMKSNLEQIGKDTFNEKRLCTEHFSTKRRQLEDTLTKLEKLGNDCDDIRRNLNNLKKKEKQREVRIAQHRTEIARLEEITSVQPTENDTSEINDKIDDLSMQMRKIQMDGQDFKDNLEKLDDDSNEIRRQLLRIDQQRKELEDIRERRLESLRNEHHTIEAVKWLRLNRDQLVGHVFYPLCVEINVIDVKYADAIETAIGQNYRTFVCEDQRDYHTMTKELCDVRKLRINIVCFFNTTLNDFPPPMPRDRLKRLGFDCYLLDQIEAPTTLLNALCNLSHLHKIPVALRKDNVNNIEVEESRAFNRYFVGDTSYSLTWSKYGKRLVQSFTTRLKQARILNNSVNVEQRHELEQQLQKLRADLTEISNARQESMKEEESLRETFEKLREEKNCLIEQKRQLLLATREYQRNKIKLDSKREQLKRLVDSPNSIKEEEDELKENLHNIAEKRAGVVKKFQNLLEESIELFNRRNKATLKYIQASSDLIALVTQTQQLDDTLKQAQINYNEANRTFDQAKAEAKNLFDECTSNTIEGEKLRKVSELSKDKTLEELEDAVTSERTKAEMHYAVDSRVIQLYEQRKAEIDSLRSRLTFKTTRLSKLTSDMKSIRENWEPKLNALIKEISNTFSEAFDRIGCAGEVRISTHEDYDKWGIDILVKFRDNEKLQILNAQRQSGGERSVSTIMYLMSLQELAKAPFRVVDEINQGMDPRNERLVHGQIVQTACRPNTSQYFLITPKLLPDLEYHERMKILCIYNGEWQPEKMDWHKFIKDRKSLNSS
ncbi:P-loop containing nucleoside triphosphate hydrolase protein [Glomus cerebriforme]|uniref:Structural maintenance of chromosomes protein 5 n=1 Tax=Glomus cerebriforme TaxID=658196 RepID=A0A397STG1_9GLOM|nr:P-loop containing nucleoside triphosphate hydrolase protein [Glomus cerebriforme]